MFAFGTSAMLSEALATVSEPAAVSASATVKGRGPVEVLWVMVTLAMEVIVGLELPTVAAAENSDVFPTLSVAVATTLLQGFTTAAGVKVMVLVKVASAAR